MRIISGKRKGLTLKTIESDSTRPTRDMVKEALFSILMQQVPNSRFLDLFAGSGAIGIEALSRGADFCIFADKNPKCVTIIHENLKKAQLEGCSKVYQADYQKVLQQLRDERFDIIYLDPPYHKEMAVKAIQIISDMDLLNNDGIIVIETDTNEIVPNVIRKV